MENSTIAAIATPVASGGVGVIRMSGPGSKDILSQVFHRFTGSPTFSINTMRSHRFYHGYIASNAQMIDEVLVVLMLAPRSYTGEDVVEIHAHGSPLLLRTIMQLVVKAGAQIAEPGEFTRRAFINGRIDLTQAEAVADIIEARSEKALHAAADQAAGKIKKEICALRAIIVNLLSEIEAAIDFPDQAERPAYLDIVKNSLRSGVGDRIQHLIERHDAFSWIKTGVTVALVGSPNVGKSTLLNTLLGRNRAIVAATPGTTRDFIEETILLDGLSFVFTDTAGLRLFAGDEVEKTGMERTRDVLSRADTIFFMVDAGAGVSKEEQALMATLAGGHVMVVANKTDLPAAETFVFPPEWAAMVPLAKISALTGEGVSALKDLLVERYHNQTPVAIEEGLIPNLRHRVSLDKALQAILSAVAAIENGLSEDVVAIDLREAIAAMNEITGADISPDVLDEIFSRFCVGK